LRVVVDWDGTITVQDSLVQVIHEFGDPALLAELEPRVGVDLTLHEEIAAEFAAITAPLDDVVAWVLENVEVRPGLRELAALGPLVVSAGFHELIEPVLAREGVELEVLANRVHAGPDADVLRYPRHDLAERRRHGRELERDLLVQRQVDADSWLELLEQPRVAELAQHEDEPVLDGHRPVPVEDELQGVRDAT